MLQVQSRHEQSAFIYTVLCFWMSTYFNSPKLITLKMRKRHYGPPEGGPLFDIHLDIVTAFLRDSYFLYN